MVNPHTSAPAPYFTPDATLAEVDTEQLACMVRRLDRDVRQARRALPYCAVIEDVAYFAARCRIELRRRQAADRDCRGNGVSSLTRRAWVRRDGHCE